MFPKKYLPEDRLRQRVCQSSPELRALASKLELAYINKERAAQVAERKLAGREEELARQREEEEIRLEKEMIEERERREIAEDQISKIRYQQQLDEQMKIQASEREKIFQQFLTEKEMIDKAVRKIQRENEAAALARLTQKKATKEQIEEFKRSQEVWRKIEEEKVRLENLEIAKFSQSKEKWKEQVEIEQKNRREVKNEAVMRLAGEIKQREQVALEREEILLELHEGRKAEEEAFKEQLEMEENIKRRLRLREGNQLAEQYRREREAKEKAEEEHYRQLMLAKFAEDDKLDQMNAQKRRMKREEHKRAVLVLMEERRENKKREKGLERMEDEMRKRDEEEQRKIVEEERQRLLQQNVERLVGHIPRGVLSQTDVEMLGGRLKTIYSKEAPSDPLLDLERLAFT